MRQRNFKTLRERVSAFLQRRGASSVKRNIISLATGITEERVQAAEDLGLSGSAPWEVIPALVLALTDPSLEVRRSAERALTSIGEPLWLEAA